LIEVEQAAFPLDQRGLDGSAVWMQPVEHLVVERIFLQRVEADAENIGERRPPDPGRHGVLRGGGDQPIERHRTGEPTGYFRQAAVSQNLVKPKPLPELVADVNRSGLTMLFGGDTRWINFDQCTGSRAQRRCRWFGLSARLIGSPRLHARNNLGDFGVIAIERMILTDERVLDFAGELEPLFARPRAEVAERTDRLLTRPFGRHHGLDQHVVGVGLAVVGATRFADVVRSKKRNGRDHGHLSTGRIAVLQTFRHILGRSMPPPLRDNSRGKGTVMDWTRILAYVTGTVDQELLARNEYLTAENRILKSRLNERLKLSDAERAMLGKIGHRLGRQALAEVATVARPDTILAWYRKLIAGKFDGSKARWADRGLPEKSSS
jgi:hypothetical protein